MKSLEIFIGLFFVYLVLSTLVTSVSEIVAAYFHFKARVLRQTIRRLFANNQDLEDAFFSAPQIDSLIDPSRKKKRFFVFKPAKDAIAPSHLDSSTFSEIIISQIRQGDSAASSIGSFETSLSQWADNSDLGDIEQRRHLENSLRDQIRNAELSVRTTPQLSELRALHQAICKWYDEGMERSRGIYKRKLQRVVIFSSFIITLLLNADSIKIIHALSANQEVLASTVESATKKLKEHIPTKEIENDTAPQLQAAVDKLEQTTAELENAGIPLGWEEGQLKKTFSSIRNFLMVFAGLLSTAIAASLGAPFWYDILNKLAEVRSTSAPTAQTNQESEGGMTTSPQNTTPIDAPSPLAKSLNQSFVDQREDFSLDRAFWLASCSRAAYNSFASIQLSLPSWGFSMVTPFGDDSGDTTRGTQGFLAASNECIIIVFRGTEISELQDLLTDADLRQSKWEAEGRPALSVHNGFLKAYQTVQKKITALLTEAIRENPERSIWLSGHSLGAALATLCAADLITRKIPISGLYTFGSPRVGNKEFIAYMNDESSNQIFRFVNEDDPVTEVPFEPFWNYSHIGQLRYLDRFSRINTNRATWKRILRKTAFWVDLGNPESSKATAIDSLKAEFKKRGGFHSMDAYIEKISDNSGHNPKELY